MLKQTWFNFLNQEGFDPTLEENAFISFFKENYRFDVIVEIDNDEFHFVRLLCIVDVSKISNFESLKFYKICDYLNFRQKGTKFMPGNNVGLAKNFNIFATMDGIVKFERYNREKQKVSVYPA